MEHETEDCVRAIEEMNLATFVSPRTVARIFDIEPKRVYDMVAEGKLTAIRMGKRGIRISSQSIIEFVRQAMR